MDMAEIILSIFIHLFPLFLSRTIYSCRFIGKRRAPRALFTGQREKGYRITDSPFVSSTFGDQTRSHSGFIIAASAFIMRYLNTKSVPGHLNLIISTPRHAGRSETRKTRETGQVVTLFFTVGAQCNVCKVHAYLPEWHEPSCIVSAKRLVQACFQN